MVKKIVIKLIVFYRETFGHNKAIGVIAPLPCRFYPTCSEFAEEAISKYGIPKGGLLALRRLLQCRPFGRSGYDPVK